MNSNANHLHNAFFTLKDASPESIRDLIADCTTYLAPLDGILFFAAGAREEECTREVNDEDFHVALTVLFETRAAHDAYQTADGHNRFVERNRDNWAQVRVFDSSPIAR